MHQKINLKTNFYNTTILENVSKGKYNDYEANIFKKMNKHKKEPENILHYPDLTKQNYSQKQKEIVEPKMVETKIIDLQPIIVEKEMVIEKEMVVESEIEKKQKQTQDLANNVFYSLVNLHEKRTNDYINMWGYDEWERMFRFPNYNYSYFDDLDDDIE
jgi:hypothetical protein